jgi:hypothetical protein
MPKLADIVALFLGAAILHVLANRQFKFFAFPAQLALTAQLRIGRSYNQLTFIELSDRLERLLHSYWQNFSLIALSRVDLGMLLAVEAGRQNLVSLATLLVLGGDFGFTLGILCRREGSISQLLADLWG